MGSDTNKSDRFVMHSNKTSGAEHSRCKLHTKCHHQLSSGGQSNRTRLQSLCITPICRLNLSTKSLYSPAQPVGSYVKASLEQCIFKYRNVAASFWLV